MISTSCLCPIPTLVSIIKRVLSYGKILRRRSIVAECPFIVDIVSIVCMYVHL